MSTLCLVIFILVYSLRRENIANYDLLFGFIGQFGLLKHFHRVFFLSLIVLIEETIFSAAISHMPFRSFTRHWYIYKKVTPDVAPYVAFGGMLQALI